MKFSSSLFSGAAGLGLLLVHAQAATAAVPVNRNASTSARKLLTHLANTASNGTTLSGQQELEDAEWLAQNVGYSPAILGVDLMDYSPSRVELGAKASTIEDAISYSKHGGIITICWHWGSPSGSNTSTSDSWYNNFYTEGTTFNLSSAIQPSSPDYKLLIRDIDAIAKQLARVKDTPILFRPLHEADGGWFWWGAAGPEPCKALYHLLFDRLTKTHGLNNLLWVWNSKSPEWYPGNDFVDIVSVDIYADKGNHSSQIADYRALQTLTGNSTKPIALGEVGNIPDPKQTLNDGAKWAYWLTWNGDFIRGEDYNPAHFKREVYASKNVLTLDDVQGFKA
ncbi:putative mannan endo-1,4-beta-mannosidase E [Aspergillus undulatus]|uniref:putative mannan endo-1,4-beta-mannosidase E n=1 Tax=Aspergillus undulatus TaxID=1810928 RepID=UPI003CCDE319